MITRLQIQNFKCLRDVNVSLAPLTILIGPNDSGKSSILDAINLLGQMPFSTIQQVFAGPLSLRNLVWMKEPTNLVEWGVKGSTEGTEFTYGLSLSPPQEVVVEEGLLYGGSRLISVERQGPQGQPIVTFGVVSRPGEAITQKYTTVLQAKGRTGLAHYQDQIPGAHQKVAEALTSTGKYQLDTSLLRKPCAIAPDPVLAPDGSNLVAVLDAIASGPDRDAITALEENLRQAIPTLRGIHLPATKARGEKALEFTLALSKSPTAIPADLASDGAVLLTAFLALAYGDTPPLILIEEPENGIHYSLLGRVVDLLRKISTGEVGNRPRQVIMTTHSPLLLNFAKPEEVRVCQRTSDGATSVTPMDKVADLDRLLKEFAPGELWYLMGEEKIAEEAKS
jgi:predicted ATPase